jgi:SAM-dependent methyltransferase
MKLKNSFCYALFFILLMVCATSAWAQKSAEEAFTEIYKNKIWGTNSDGEGSSGTGSKIQKTKIYRHFLRDFLAAYKIQSVVDAGCGDWEFSRKIKWDGISYIGYDVVGFVIAKNKAAYECENIHFIHADAILTNLPPADLLICKDVLQHLPLEDIASFITQMSKYKYCLLTNDIDPSTGSSQNPQIERGDYRSIDLTQAPFFLNGVKILTFWAKPALKQVLLIDRSESFK